MGGRCEREVGGGGHPDVGDLLPGRLDAGGTEGGEGGEWFEFEDGGEWGRMGANAYTHIHTHSHKYPNAHTESHTHGSAHRTSLTLQPPPFNTRVNDARTLLCSSLLYHGENVTIIGSDLVLFNGRQADALDIPVRR